VPLDTNGWKKVGEDPDAFASTYAVSLGTEADTLRAVGEQTAAWLDRTGLQNPWGGYLGIDRARAVIVGTCGFKGPPDESGTVEIAYFTFPSFEGQGYGRAMAAELVARAALSPEVRRVRAHTLPERNPSTSILQNLGFRRLAEVRDPEDGLVWRWERDPS
jgi:RimJ/RimL family protein N-acetyltransferase